MFQPGCVEECQHAVWQIAARFALGHCAYGEQVGAAAVVSLSGFMADDDLTRWVRAGANLPPALLVSSEHDLDYIRDQAEPMRAHMAASAVVCEAWRVPVAGHFYPAGSETVNTDGGRATVIQAMAAFLTGRSGQSDAMGFARWGPDALSKSGCQHDSNRNRRDGPGLAVVDVARQAMREVRLQGRARGVPGTG